MLPQPARRNVRGAGSVLAVLAGLSVTLSSLSCDKVPLLAPTGSVITLFATAATVPSNGSMEIVGTVIEQGTASTTTPPANGRAQPRPRPRHPHLVPALRCTTARWLPLRRRSGELSRARRARTTVRSASGSTPTARAAPRSSPRSPVAHPGSSRTSESGSAGAERILLSASPQALPCSGGNSQVSARVEDVSGVGLPAGPGGLHHHERDSSLRRPPRQTRAAWPQRRSDDEPGSDGDGERRRQDSHRDCHHQSADTASASRRQRATSSRRRADQFHV